MLAILGVTPFLDNYLDRMDHTQAAAAVQGMHHHRLHTYRPGTFDPYLSDAVLVGKPQTHTTNVQIEELHPWLRTEHSDPLRSEPHSHVPLSYGGQVTQEMDNHPDRDEQPIPEPARERDPFAHHHDNERPMGAPDGWTRSHVPLTYGGQVTHVALTYGGQVTAPEHRKDQSSEDARADNERGPQGWFGEDLPHQKAGQFVDGARQTFTRGGRVIESGLRRPSPKNDGYEQVPTEEPGVPEPSRRIANIVDDLVNQASAAGASEAELEAIRNLDPEAVSRLGKEAGALRSQLMMTSDMLDVIGRGGTYLDFLKEMQGVGHADVTPFTLTGRYGQPVRVMFSARFREGSEWANMWKQTFQRARDLGMIAEDDDRHMFTVDERRTFNNLKGMNFVGNDGKLTSGVTSEQLDAFTALDKEGRTAVMEEVGDVFEFLQKGTRKIRPTIAQRLGRSLAAGARSAAAGGGALAGHLGAGIASMGVGIVAQIAAEEIADRVLPPDTAPVTREAFVSGTSGLGIGGMLTGGRLIGGAVGVGSGIAGASFSGAGLFAALQAVSAEAGPAGLSMFATTQAVKGIDAATEGLDETTREVARFTGGFGTAILTYVPLSGVASGLMSGGGVVAGVGAATAAMPIMMTLAGVGMVACVLTIVGGQAIAHSGDAGSTIVGGVQDQLAHRDNAWQYREFGDLF